ncbi:MAG TPA: tyrosine-type recombinase/integrase [Armatimonadota bacterium]|jgi:integrase/recombinase XerC
MGQTIILPDVGESWLVGFQEAQQAQGRSEKTRVVYERELRLLAGVLLRQTPILQPVEVTTNHLFIALVDEAIIRTCRGTLRSPATLHRLKAATQRFFAWASQTGRLAENPAIQMQTQRLHRKPPAFLTDAEITRLRKEFQGRTGDAVQRDRLILEVFLGTGIRLQELVDLKIEDVDLDAKHLHIRSAKGGVPQVKFLHTRLRGLLRTYLKWRVRQGTECCPALFISQRGTRISPRQVAYRLDYWLREAGIDKPLTPHSLRHTFATRLYARTNDLLVVQRALGHRQIATTEIYTHLVDGTLEEALERL